MKLTADQMRSLPDFFCHITDPRRSQGKRHQVHVVLSIAAAAVLCGRRNDKAIADWAQALSPAARARFHCRYKNGHYVVPSASILRDVMIRVDATELDHALEHWNEQYGGFDERLIIDRNTMSHALSHTLPRDQHKT